MSFFGIFHTGPHPAPFTADLHCYYSKLQNQLSVNSVLRNVFMVCWHLRERFQSPGVSFHFRSVHKLTRQYMLRPYVAPLPQQVQKQHMTQRYDRTGERRIIAAPCWLPCTGRRTSVCLIGLRTLLEQSSVCSHVRRELQRERETVILIKKKKKHLSSVSKNGGSFVNDATSWRVSIWGAVSAAVNHVSTSFACNSNPLGVSLHFHHSVSGSSLT